MQFDDEEASGGDYMSDTNKDDNRDLNPITLEIHKK